MSLFLRTFIAFAVLWISGCKSLPEHEILREADLLVTVSAVDEEGKPVKFGEVWRVVSPILQRSDPYASRPRYELPLDYLDQVSHRYKDVAEFAGPWLLGFWEATVDGILTRGQFSRLVPTNHLGITKEIVKVERDRPALIKVRYAAMSHGFQPSIIERAVDPSEQKITLKIVLQKNKGVSDEGDLEHKFGKLRYQATPDSPDYRGQEHMDELRSEMLALASFAEGKGQNKLAARIYAWVPFIPTIIVFDGTSASGPRVSGYRREDERSARNLTLIEKAYALDPSNRYLQMKALLLLPPADAKEQINHLEKLLAGGDDVWPPVYFLLENLYWRLGRQDDAKRVRDRYERIDPNGAQNWPEYRKLRRARYQTIEEFRLSYVENGDVNKRDIYDRYPVHYDVQAGRVDIFDWLLKNGLKTPLESYIGVQALNSRNPAMVRRLLDLDVTIVGINTLRYLRERPDLLKSENGLWDDKQALNEIQRLIRQGDKP